MEYWLEYALWSRDCSVWNVDEWGARTVEYELYRIACDVWTVEYGLWGIECGVWHVEHGLWSMDRGR